MLTLNKRFLSAWALGIPPGYLLLGFLDNYYQSAIEILLAAFLVYILASLAIYFVLGRAIRKFQSKPVDALLSIGLGIAVITFFAALVNMASRFPRMFDATSYLLPPAALTPFVIGLAAAFPASAWMISTLRRANIQQTRFYKFVDANLGGLVIAALFFCVYFLLASIFNQPIFNFDDIFFDTDAKLWRFRFGTEHYEDYYGRTVHPFVLIVVRPWVWLISLFLKGDMLYAAFALTALTGALCVFLVWYFVRNSVGHPLYALLIATLFGASSTQLAFGSIIESYIFLGAVALIFIVLLLKDSPTYALIIAGLAAFGITISNLAQMVIAHFMVKRNIVQLIKYGLIVAALIVPLNLLNNLIYPNAHPYLWQVDTLQWEEKNVFPSTLQRANFLGRVMLLHSFIAPDPLLLKEDIPFLKVWMFRAALKKAPLQISRYETDLGKALVVIWLGFVALGGALFLKNLFKRDDRFAFVFILTILFYFVFHMRYGRDVFLYSANWTYAITLFLALAWQDLAGRRWFQVSLLGFILLLLVNNSRLILIMLWASFMHIR
ncbi:MAG: hypothetical protein HND47_02490 [Chloroflexi bacterium]|nr:hypothetical protein [Chloroflexota bacterium]